jgi:ATP synthase protein I
MSETPEELEQKIREARARQQGLDLTKPKPAANSNISGGSKAFRAATDLGAAIFVGGIFGYWLDKWLHTRPLMMILLIFAGFIAGFLNLYRSQMGKAEKKEGNKE